MVPYEPSSDDVGTIWYRLPEIERDALTKRSRVRQRSLESRTLVIPSVPSHEAAFRITGVIPEVEQRRIYDVLSGMRDHWPDDPFFSIEKSRAYWLVPSNHLCTLDSLKELFYLPMLGVFGRPTAIINGSKSFSDLLGDEGRLLALMHEVPYIDVSGEEDALNVPIRGFAE